MSSAWKSPGPRQVISSMVEARLFQHEIGDLLREAGVDGQAGQIAHVVEAHQLEGEVTDHVVRPTVREQPPRLGLDLGPRAQAPLARGQQQRRIRRRPPQAGRTGETPSRGASVARGLRLRRPHGFAQLDTVEELGRLQRHLHHGANAAGEVAAQPPPGREHLAELGGVVGRDGAAEDPRNEIANERLLDRRPPPRRDRSRRWRPRRRHPSSPRPRSHGPACGSRRPARALPAIPPPGS